MTGLERQRAVAWMHFALALARRNGSIDIEIEAVHERLKALGFEVDK